MQSAIDIANASGEADLGSLGKSLFPDPAKAAQGYYYGSEARKAQIESLRLQDQLARGHTVDNLLQGQPYAPSYTTTGFGTVLSDPNVGGAPPPMSQVVSAGPPPAAGPAAGPAVDPSHPAVVSSLANAATTLGPGMADAASRGPSPGTASDGSAAQNQPGYGPLNAGLPSGGGGVVHAPSASPDGSPALNAINIPQVVNNLVQSGMSFQAAQATVLSAIGNAVKNGHMAQSQGEQLAAFFGEPSMRNTAIQGETARATTGMTVAGEMARQQLVTGEQAREFNITPTMTADATGAPVYNTRIGAIGQPAYDSAHGGFAPYVSPSTPGAPTMMRGAEARGAGATPAAQTQEQQRAQLEQQWRLMPEGPDKDRVYQQLIAIAATPAAIDPVKQAQQHVNNYQTIQQVYAQPQTGVTQLAIKDPPALRSDAQMLLDRRTDKLMQQPYFKSHPDEASAVALQQAINNGEIQSPAEVNAARTGQLLSTAKGLKTDPRLEDRPIPTVPGKVSVVKPHMMINLTPKGRAAATELGVPVAPPVSNAAAPAGATPGATPAGAPAPAPAGAPAPAPAGAPAAASTAAPAAAAARFQGQVPPISSMFPSSNPFSAATAQAGTPQPGLPPAQPSLFGARAAPVAPAAPQAAAALPPGALGPAPPGTPEGTIGTFQTARGPVRGVNRGGIVYPVQ